ncbi:hypothetical protein CSUI_004987, partial [Cystoisospora suis]
IETTVPVSVLNFSSEPALSCLKRAGPRLRQGWAPSRPVLLRPIAPQRVGAAVAEASSTSV